MIRFGAYGYFYGRHQLGVTRTTLPVANLPAPLEGVRIGLITDIHRSATVSHEDVDRAVSALMAERPDLVVLGGDYVPWGAADFKSRRTPTVQLKQWGQHLLKWHDGRFARHPRFRLLRHDVLQMGDCQPVSRVADRR